MNTGNQNEFIAKVKAALGYAITDERPSSDQLGIEDSGVHTGLLEKIHTRSNDERKKLLNLLIERGKPLNLEVIPKKDAGSVSRAIKNLVQEKNPEWGSHKSVAAWKHPLIQKLSLPEILADEEVPVHYTALTTLEKNSRNIEAGQAKIRQHVIDSYIGVTSADYCVANTATLIMKARPGLARSVSLVPSIHVAVIELKQVISDLKELYTLLIQDPREKVEGLSNCMTCITGPSKTADIELYMVHGAHGPRELHLFVITG
jgi:L-lactate dehydrogenase complex protein LldG